MQATALSPKSRTTLYLSIICTYLVLIVCVQFILILMLRNETETVVANILREKNSDCESSHSIVKRQINRGWQVCPPGCVRRRRKRPFGAIARSESIIHPETYSGFTGTRGQAGLPGESGQSGWPGESGQPGWAGTRGQSGWPGESGQPGSPGESGQRGFPGESGQTGWPGQRGLSGQSGWPGTRGQAGMPGESGQSGWPGESGSPGLPGSPGGMGLPGLSGASQQGGIGQQGQLGGQGARGPSGGRGQPGHNDLNYNTYLGPSLRSGLSRGDQYPTEHPYYTTTASTRNDTSASKLLKEFRLYPHPECKDDVDHRALMDTLKDKGKVSFMILVDLQGNEYCIVHS